MQKQISVTRALVELKRSEDVINRATTEGLFIAQTVGMDQNRKVLQSQDSVQVTTDKIVASFQKVEQAIANRAALKSAIVLSNATTIVQLGGKSMTVAEAIELKSSVQFKRLLLNVLRQRKNSAETNVFTSNNLVDELIQKHLTSVYGAEKSKISDETVKAIADPQYATKKAALLDPCTIAKKIEELQEEISVIESELDFVLSESNAKTEITVEL